MRTVSLCHLKTDPAGNFKKEMQLTWKMVAYFEYAYTFQKKLAKKENHLKYCSLKIVSLFYIVNLYNPTS